MLKLWGMSLGTYELRYTKNIILNYFENFKLRAG
jgi:hypothetical protein